MLFKLSIKSTSSRTGFKNNSALVLFAVDSHGVSNQLDSIVSEFSTEVGRNLRNSFTSDKRTEIKFYPPQGKPDIVFIKKVKIDEKLSYDFFRDYISGLIQTLVDENVSRLKIIPCDPNLLPEYVNHSELIYQAVAEGLYLGNYSFDRYKSDRKAKSELYAEIYGESGGKLKEILRTTGIVAESVYLARDLSNEPAITLTPSEFVKRVRSALRSERIKFRVFKREELLKRKMNAIVAVGDASVHSPMMLTLHYKPAGKVRRKVALVGKGVTYDSGGLSLKPSDAMIEMKGDMAGASAVAGIIKAASELEFPVEIIGIMPLVENMVAGNSYKPGDIVVSASGKSIEIGNTDAEGRVILADALHYVSGQKPDEIIDFATLTGACIVALGDFVAGLFTHEDRLAADLISAGSRTQERLWRLPMWHEYGKLIESKIADVKNVGPRWAGAITAAKFLENFVDKNIPWAHIDLAGPSIKHDLNNYTKNYNTGFGVRLIIDYLKNSFD